MDIFCEREIEIYKEEKNVVKWFWFLYEMGRGEGGCSGELFNCHT